MKKIIIMAVLILGFSSTKAQTGTYYQEGYQDGVEIAQYVIDTYIAHNIPAKEFFRETTFTEAGDGFMHVGVNMSSGGTDVQTYNFYVSTYGSPEGMWEFYESYLLDYIQVNSANNPYEYNNGLMDGFTQRRQGLNPTIAP